MRTDELKGLLRALGRLTAAQQQRVLTELEGARSLDEASVIIEKRLAERPTCPARGAERVVRNGFASGLQRYKCRDCGITFNALTGTPLARLRHRDKRLGQATMLTEGLSVRKAAERLGVHRTTAFRWRHRWLARPCEVKAGKMVGVVEADETYHLRSYKGQKARLGAPLQRHLDPLPAELPRLVPRARPQRQDEARNLVSAGPGRRRANPIPNQRELSLDETDTTHRFIGVQP